MSVLLVPFWRQLKLKLTRNILTSFFFTKWWKIKILIFDVFACNFDINWAVKNVIYIKWTVQISTFWHILCKIFENSTWEALGPWSLVSNSSHYPLIWKNTLKSKILVKFKPHNGHKNMIKELWFVVSRPNRATPQNHKTKLKVIHCIGKS